MINHISISNFAIIDNTEIDFEDGLNVITGETGAGKSIVIEAVSLALGSRADSAFVRYGADKAVVQLAGELDGEEIVITREVSSSGKNLCRLNGQLVTLTELGETCRRLADIHGQYDNQSLLNPDNHLSLVDRYSRDKIAPVRKAFDEAYEQYHVVRSKLNSLLSKEAENARKHDFYRFERDEIDKANLIPGEDEALTDRVLMLQNSERVFDAIETAHEAMKDEEAGAMNAVGTCINSLKSVTQYSREISSIADEMDDIYYRLDDLCSSIRDIREKTVFSPEELNAAIARLDLIDGLKKKYGQTIDEILSYRDRIAAELDEIENFDDIRTKLTAETAEAKKAVIAQAALLTEARKLSAASLEQKIIRELHDLNFDSAQLAIEFKPNEQIGPTGSDNVEMMITTNKGEPLKPLAKIASGGEISRIMLAIKNITSEGDRIPTMIFDEIDAGISGVTASVVAKKLREISKTHQIICITHLPQIAAAGDSNYRIFKESDDTSTFTFVEKLDQNGKIDEIARLLGGVSVTDNTRRSAAELIAASKQ